ncbi:MAG: NAD(P)-binding domain-containing protein [Saprospiraceae bacterium]
MQKKIGIIGSGPVGITLANGFQKHGYEVMLGTNDAEKHDSLKEKTNGKISIGTFPDVAKFAEIIVLAVKGSAAEEALRKTGFESLKNKIILDTTNPIAAAPPTNGVLHFFTTLEESLMEQLQNAVPDAKFVKCFSCVGNARMIDPDFGGVRPSMFIAGNDEQAKHITSEILNEIGWDTEDMGKAEGARAIEPLCILWCIPGMLKGQWSHAFKVLR